VRIDRPIGPKGEFTWQYFYVRTSLFWRLGDFIRENPPLDINKALNLLLSDALDSFDEIRKKKVDPRVKND